MTLLGIIGLKNFLIYLKARMLKIFLLGLPAGSEWIILGFPILLVAMIVLIQRARNGTGDDWDDEYK